MPDPIGYRHGGCLNHPFAWPEVSWPVVLPYRGLIRFSLSIRFIRSAYSVLLLFGLRILCGSSIRLDRLGRWLG